MINQILKGYWAIYWKRNDCNHNVRFINSRWLAWQHKIKNKHRQSRTRSNYITNVAGTKQGSSHGRYRTLRRVPLRLRTPALAQPPRPDDYSRFRSDAFISLSFRSTTIGHLSFVRRQWTFLPFANIPSFVFYVRRMH